MGILNIIIAQKCQKSNSMQRGAGFTIVELLIVIVVIGILAAITVVSYNGIQGQARKSALKAEVRENGTQLYAAHQRTGLPATCEEAKVRFSGNPEINCHIVPDRSGFCLSGRIDATSYYVSSTNPTLREGTCDRWILVPANKSLGTPEFWAMYDQVRKSPNGTPSSEASLPIYNSISQINAIARSKEACEGCRLIADPEWMAIAAALMNVPENWTGGAVGSGRIYNSSDAGHRDLTLKNGETIHDFAGDLWEWTSATIAGGQQPGSSGYSSREWTSITNWGGLPVSARPESVGGQAYSSTEGVGRIHSNSSETTVRGYLRGGDSTSERGIFSLALHFAPDQTSPGVGFRITRP